MPAFSLFPPLFVIAVSSPDLAEIMSGLVKMIHHNIGVKSIERNSLDGGFDLMLYYFTKFQRYPRRK